MPLYAAFLRGINLGKRRVKMTDLAAQFESLGFEDVATFIASGNVVFRSRSAAREKLEQKIEAKLKSAWGFEVETFVRTADEVGALLALPAFRRELRPENTLCVAFLKEELDAATAKALEDIRTDADEFSAHGREFFWLTQGGISQSVVWELPETRKLKLPSSTLRNMNTIRKLAAKHGMAAN